MNPEQGLLRQILLWLWSRHIKAVPDLKGRMSDVHECVSAFYTQFDERELEKLLSQDDPPAVNFNKLGKCLFLEPEERQKMIPVLTLKYDFERSIPEVRFQVALFLFDEDNNSPQAIGFRFESPEGEGVHHYYHAQPITSFGNHQLPCPQWIPKRQPAFTLDAENSVTLFLCLLISVYGLDFLYKELQTAPFSACLQTYIRGMKCLIFTPTYWEMRIDGERVFYKTWEKDKNKFKTIMQQGYRARDIVEINRESYEAQDQLNRHVY